MRHTLDRSPVPNSILRKTVCRITELLERTFRLRPRWPTRLALAINEYPGLIVRDLAVKIVAALLARFGSASVFAPDVRGEPLPVRHTASERLALQVVHGVHRQFAESNYALVLLTEAPG